MTVSTHKADTAYLSARWTAYSALAVRKMSFYSVHLPFEGDSSPLQIRKRKEIWDVIVAAKAVCG